MISEHILASVERLRRSIDSLLGLLRLEASIGGEARERVAYADVIEDVLREYSADPRFSDYELHAEVASNTGEAVLIVPRWKELLRNLIDNALVQPATRKALVLRIERTARGIVTSVIDFGPGISPGNRDLIFRRFFTQRPLGAPPGSGLGLSIVRAIAEAHNAEIEVESTPGQGAAFRIILAA
jgi:two-component system OmpR family sensor kinase